MANNVHEPKGVSESLWSLFRSLASLIFGKFESEEFKKFVRMGLVFTLIIGSYWTLRTLKNGVFINLVSGNWLPIAKTVSILFLIPVVGIYSTLLNRHSREKMFYIVPLFYGLAILLVGVLFFFVQAPTAIVNSRPMAFLLFTKFVGFLQYVLIESYGSLLPALFWAFASEVTGTESAKKGFPLIYAIGQIGAIFGPKYLLKLPKYFEALAKKGILPQSLEGLYHSGALPAIICALFTLLIIASFRYFLRVTPKSVLASYTAHAQKAESQHKEEPGFLEGLWLMLQHGYLFGIFASIFVFEFIVTVFDFNFQKAIEANFGHSNALMLEYQGYYGSWVNTVTLACLLLGVGNIARLLGVGIALAMVPVIVGGALYTFIAGGDINLLLVLMVGSKAIGYALNGPAQKQLYIPLSHDARFKAQAWIESFGSRLSKEGGSLFNLLYKPLGAVSYIAWTGYLGFPMIAVWFCTALYLGARHKRAVQENKIVC